MPAATNQLCIKINSCFFSLQSVFNHGSKRLWEPCGREHTGWLLGPSRTPSPYPTRGKNRAPAGLTGQNRLKEAKQLLGGRTPKENPGRGSGASPGWGGGGGKPWSRQGWRGGGLTRAGCYRHKLFSAPGTLRRGSAPLTGRGGNPQQPHTDPTRTDSSSTKGVVCVCVCPPPQRSPINPVRPQVRSRPRGCASHSQRAGAAGCAGAQR